MNCYKCGEVKDEYSRYLRCSNTSKLIAEFVFIGDKCSDGEFHFAFPTDANCVLECDLFKGQEVDVVRAQVSLRVFLQVNIAIHN